MYVLQFFKNLAQTTYDNSYHSQKPNRFIEKPTMPLNIQPFSLQHQPSTNYFHTQAYTSPVQHNAAPTYEPTNMYQHFNPFEYSQLYKNHLPSTQHQTTQSHSTDQPNSTKTIQNKTYISILIK